MQKPVTLFVLAFLLVLLGLGGLYGGTSMLIDPSGNLLQMADVLPLLPVPDYTLPGLFLFSVMGVVPLLLAYALLARPDWKWALTATLLLGLTLAAWLTYQGLLIGFRWPVQYFTATVGLLIITLSLLPGVRRHYAKGEPGDR